MSGFLLWLSTAFLDVLPGRAKQGPLEVVADQRPAGLEQLVEGLEQPPLSGLGLPTLRLDALAHVAVEEVDRLPRSPVDGGRVILAQVHQRADGHTGREELHSGGDGLEVVGGVEELVTTLDRNEQAGLLEADQERLGDAR